MKTRAVYELLQSTCPECGEPQYGEENYCRRCGTMLVSPDSESEAVAEEDMKALATASKASIVSNVLSAPRITFENIFLVIGIPFMVLLFGGVITNDYFMENSIITAPLVVTVSIFLPIYIALQFLIVCRPFLRFRSVLKKGGQLPAVVLGYSSCMNHSVVESDLNGETTYPTVKVLTKIDGVDRTVVLYAPDGMTEKTCPIGTSITIIGNGNDFIVGPRLSIRAQKKVTETPKTDETAAIQQLESLNDIDPLTGLPIRRGTRQ